MYESIGVRRTCADSRMSVKPPVSSMIDLALGGAGDADVDAVGDDAVVERVGGATSWLTMPLVPSMSREKTSPATSPATLIDVAAEAADDARRDARRGREDVERVVALEAVDLEQLDVRVGHREAGAVDRLRRDDEVVGELGAEDDDLVDAGAAVDRDGRVDVVLDLVLPAPVRMSVSAAVEKPLVSFGIATGAAGSRQTMSQSAPPSPSPDRSRRRSRCRRSSSSGERERAHEELVVAVVALEPQRRLVGVDAERAIRNQSRRT